MATSSGLHEKACPTDFTMRSDMSRSSSRRSSTRVLLGRHCGEDLAEILHASLSPWAPGGQGRYSTRWPANRPRSVAPAPLPRLSVPAPGATVVPSAARTTPRPPSAPGRTRTARPAPACGPGRARDAARDGGPGSAGPHRSRSYGAPDDVRPGGPTTCLLVGRPLLQIGRGRRPRRVLLGRIHPPPLERRLEVPAHPHEDPGHRDRRGQGVVAPPRRIDLEDETSGEPGAVQGRPGIEDRVRLSPSRTAPGGTTTWTRAHPLSTRSRSPSCPVERTSSGRPATSQATRGRASRRARAIASAREVSAKKSPSWKRTVRGR